MLIGDVELDDVLQPWGANDLTVLPAGRVPPNPSELLSTDPMRELVESLTAEFDYVLIDAPPLLAVTDAAILSSITTGALVVTAAGSTTKTEFLNVLGKLEAIGKPALGIVVSKLLANSRGRYGYGEYVYKYDQFPEQARGRKSAR